MPDMKKTIVISLSIVLMLFSFVACNNGPSVPGGLLPPYIVDRVTYTLEVPEYAYPGEVISGVIVGSDGSRETVSITVPSDAVAGSVITVTAKGYSASLTITDTVIDDPTEAADQLAALEDGDVVLLRSSSPIALTQFRLSNDNIKLIGDGETEIELTATSGIDGQSLFAVNGSNVVIEGLNFSVTGTGNYNVIKVSGKTDSPVDNIVIKDVTIDCGESGAKGLNLHHTTNAVIENVTVTGTPVNDSLSIAESTGLIVRNCNFVVGAWGYAVQINWDNNDDYVNGCDVTFDGVENIPSVYVTDAIWTGSEYEEVPNGHKISGLDSFGSISVESPEKEQGRYFVPKATSAEVADSMKFIGSIMHNRIFNGINGALGKIGEEFSWSDKLERGSLTVVSSPEVSESQIVMEITFKDFQYNYTDHNLRNECNELSGTLTFILNGEKSSDTFTATNWEVKSSMLIIDEENYAIVESATGSFNPSLIFTLGGETVTGIQNPAVAKFSADNLSCKAIFNGKAIG